MVYSEKWHVANKLVKREMPAGALYTDEYIKHANAQLGPAPAISASTTKPGCR